MLKEDGIVCQGLRSPLWRGELLSLSGSGDQLWRGPEGR